MQRIKTEFLSGINLLINSQNLLLIDDLNSRIEEEKRRNSDLEEKIRTMEEKTQKIIKQKELEYNLLRIDYVTNLESLALNPKENKLQNDITSTPPGNRNGKKIENVSGNNNSTTTLNAPKTVTLTNLGNGEQKFRGNKKRKYVNNHIDNNIGRKEMQSAQTAINYLLNGS